jgi:hypothetical protein
MCFRECGHPGWAAQCQMQTYPRRPFAVSLAGIASNDRSLRARAP